jgi:hypothetical protein
MFDFMTEIVLETLTNETGDERVLIVRRADGVFTYRHQWNRDGGWSGALDLGLYDSAGTAEAEARLRVGWLVPAFH